MAEVLTKVYEQGTLFMETDARNAPEHACQVCPDDTGN